MKVLLFGPNGMLGRYIFAYLKQFPKYDVVPIDRKTFEVGVDSINDLDEIVFEYYSDEMIIINCIGLIPQNIKKVGDINMEKREYYLVNSIFPIKLASIAEKYGLRMIHITTDCVFDGKIGKYNEIDYHSETNDYGLSKSLGEPDNCCIIRTSIIGEELENKRSLLEWVRSNKDGEINGYADHYWNGITCLQVAKIIDEMIEKDIYWMGVRHIFSPTSFSKYEIVKMINDIYELNIKINQIKCEKVDKTLATLHGNIFYIPELWKQIEEMRKFNLK